MATNKNRKYLLNQKSGAFNLVDPPTRGRLIYFTSQKDYKSILISLLMKTSNRLNSLGVGVKVLVNGDTHKKKII